VCRSLCSPAKRAYRNGDRRRRRDRYWGRFTCAGHRRRRRDCGIGTKVFLSLGVVIVFTAKTHIVVGHAQQYNIICFSYTPRVVSVSPGRDKALIMYCKRARVCGNDRAIETSSSVRVFIFMFFFLSRFRSGSYHQPKINYSRPSDTLLLYLIIYIYIYWCVWFLKTIHSTANTSAGSTHVFSYSHTHTYDVRIFFVHDRFENLKISNLGKHVRNCVFDWYIIIYVNACLRSWSVVSHILKFDWKKR